MAVGSAGPNMTGTMAERIAEARRGITVDGDYWPLERGDLERAAWDLLAAIDHVIAVLRQAERCGGGYGFARQLLRYLGADQEGQG